MAKKQKQEEAPAGSPAWMATFSDLMNLLLCFFVLLFSMSSVDTDKFQALIASLQSEYSILNGGGAAIGDGKMISAGINQLQKYDIYYNPKMTNSGEGESDAKKRNIVAKSAEDDGQNDKPEDGFTDIEGEGTSDALTSSEEAKELYEEAELAESEKMAGKVEKLLEQLGIEGKVDVDFNGQYVSLTLNGAILFNSGAADLTEEAYPLVDKIGKILEKFTEYTIEIEGHTDNVPIHSGQFKDNNVLSMYRALSVADYLRDTTKLNPAQLKSSGRGDYVPVADNSTPEGRAQNRRVVVKIYNSYNSDLQ